MLLNLRTIYKPETLDDAIALLADPVIFPLYGGVALQRSGRSDAHAAVDLSRVGLSYVRDTENNLRLGTMLTLEAVRQACAERAVESPRIGAVAQALAEEFPETMRNTMTLGDLLMERPTQSPTLALFLALGVVIKRVDIEMYFTTAAWLAMRDNIQRFLIAHVRLLRGSSQAVVASEKVARTPADLPIVHAVACVDHRDDGRTHTTLALAGVARTPIPQPVAARRWDETGDMDTVLAALEMDPPSDHWGSSDYRTEMAKVLVRRVLLKTSRKD